MPGRPEVTIDDFNRLLTESNLGERADMFFAKEGLSEDIMAAIVNSARRGLTGLLLAAMADDSDDDPGEVMGNICATMMTAGFALGWEGHKQFGGDRASASWEDPA